MFQRITLLLALFVSVGAPFSYSLLAADEPRMHEGTVVSAAAGKLVMTDAAGKQHTHSISESTKITVNGKQGKLTDLQMSMKILVTMEANGDVLSVATIDTHKLPAL